MGEIWHDLLKFWHEFPALAWAGLVALLGSLWLIVVNTVRGKLGEWLQSWLGAVLEPLDKAFKTQMARRYSLRAYCRLLLANEQFRYLFVPGADDNDSKLDVDRAFVTLRLENTSAAGPQWFDHKNLLKLGKRVRVVGDPGSGKSSLVKRILRDACQRALFAPKTAKLPVLLELRRLKLPGGVDDAAALGQWLLGAVKQQVAQYTTIHKPAECFDAYFAGPGLLVLLDGLDEVASDAYTHMREALLDLSQKLALNPNNQVVLTMRSQFHQQVKNDFRDDGSHAVMVQPFTPGDIYQFLQRWPFRGKDEQAAREIRIRIYRELTERVSLREMCRNPLVLAMYVAKDYGRATGLPPSSRTRFYKQVIDELLIRRSFRQGGQVSASTADSLRDHREEILATLALQHLLDPAQGANHLSWRAAIDLIRQKMQCDEAQAVGHFTELAKDTGLVVEVQKRESFRFIHLTFCEYFAALGACEWVQDGWLNLLAKHAALQGSTTDSGKNRLVEVLPFAFGLMKPMDRAKRLDTLWHNADTRMLAHTFLECKLYDYAAWPGFIDDWKTALMATPQTAWNEVWLADLHLFSVVVTDAKQHQQVKGGIQGVPDLAAFFSGMVKQHHAGLNTLLHAYAKLDAEALFSLAELNSIDLLSDFPDVVLSNCDQPIFLEAILGKALADPARSVAWAALFVEAGLRATAVADKLMQLPMEAKWQALAEATPKGNRWHQNRFMPNCLYTQCMSIANDAGAAPDSRLQLLQIFRTIPAPSGYRLITNGVWLPALLAYTSLVVGLGLWGWWQERFLPESFFTLCCVMTLSCFPAYWLKQYQTTSLLQVTCCMFGTASISQLTSFSFVEINALLAKPRLLSWRDMKKAEIFRITLAIFCGITAVASEIAVVTGHLFNTMVLVPLLVLPLVLMEQGVWLGLKLVLPPLRLMTLGLWMLFGALLYQGLVRKLVPENFLVQCVLSVGWYWLGSALGQALGQCQMLKAGLRLGLRFGLSLGLQLGLGLGLAATIPAQPYWGKKLATSIATLQQARQALGIRRA